MEKKLHNFFNSGLLEKYLIGGTSASETLKVETFINTYPEVKEEFEMLQDQLELTAKAQAVNAPDVLDTVMTRLDTKPVVHLNGGNRKSFRWLTIAACIAALVFAGTSYNFYVQNQSLVDENNTIAEEVFDLRGDIDKNNDKLDHVMRQLMKLNNPETQKYVLRGNDRAKELKTVAYINPEEKSSLIDVISLPKLNDQQEYQMWAQVNDKMINLGILDANNRNLKPVPYIEDALSLSITIEPKGRRQSDTIGNAVAEIPLNIKDN